MVCKQFYFLLFTFYFVGSQAWGADQTRKLNVLFIAVDDLNVRVGCYGFPVKTPNIDRLAQMGRRFDRAYCQYPLCNPSRTSLMSGWRPEKTRVLGNGESPRPHLEGAIPLQEYFHDHGYYTARVGKIYHGAFEDQFKWDGTQKQARAAATQPAAGTERRQRAARKQQAGGNAPADGGQNAQRPAGRAGRRGKGGDSKDGEGGGGSVVPISWVATDKEDAQEPDGHTARRIAEIIEEQKDRTFFIAAGFAKPHLPWVCPRKYFQMYSAQDMTFDPAPSDDLTDIPPIALTPTPARDPHTDAARREAIAAYQACTTFVDAQIGILLDTLDRLKLWDNTVVLFYGDHGWHLGEHGLWRKMSLFEESARAPLIIIAPGMNQPGKATEQFAEFVDIYPTLVELCGLPKVDGVEGTSLVPLMNDPSHAIKTAAFTVVARSAGIHSRGPDQLGKSVRTDRYRYTEWPDGSKELYDQQNDPHEYTNLANDPASQSIVAEQGRILKSGYRAALTAK